MEKIRIRDGKNSNPVSWMEIIQIPDPQLRVGNTFFVCDGWVAQEHVEAMHISGLAFPCTVCSSVLKTRASLRQHMMRTHKPRLVPSSFIR